MARAEATGVVDVRPRVIGARRHENLFFAVHCLTRLGEDDRKRNEENALTTTLTSIDASAKA